MHQGVGEVLNILKKKIISFMIMANGSSIYTGQEPP
jgi:hypothetical protein